MGEIVRTSERTEPHRQGDGDGSGNRRYLPCDVQQRQHAVSDLTAPANIDDPTALGDAELLSLLRRLEQEEQSVSKRRTRLHERINFVRAGGYASTDPQHESLVALQATETELSEHRLLLHAQIDALRAEHSRRRVS
jgi:hypothetical protein